MKYTSLALCLEQLYFCLKIPVEGPPLLAYTTFNYINNSRNVPPLEMQDMIIEWSHQKESLTKLRNARYMQIRVQLLYPENCIQNFKFGFETRVVRMGRGKGGIGRIEPMHCSGICCFENSFDQFACLYASVQIEYQGSPKHTCKKNLDFWT